MLCGKKDYVNHFLNISKQRARDKMNIKVSSKGGIIVTLKELVDMSRVGFKYKINHRTRDLIVLRNFLNHEINKRKTKEKENTAKDQKPTQNKD
jgi:hypothetical protein